MTIVRLATVDTGNGFRIQVDAGNDGSLVVLSSQDGAFLSRLEEDGSQVAVAPTTDYANFRSGYVETLSDGSYALYTTWHFGLGYGTRVQILERDGAPATEIVNPMYEDGQDRNGVGYTLTATQDGGFAFVWNDVSRSDEQMRLDYPMTWNGWTGNDVAAGYDVRIRYFDADAAPTGPSVVSDDDVETVNAATVNRRAGDQYINDSETLAGGETAFTYIDRRWVGASGGGAQAEWILSLQISTPGNVGEPIKIDLGPYGNQFGEYPESMTPSAGANIVPLPDGTFAVIWTERTYAPANVWGNYEYSGTQTVIRYFDAAGNALTDPVTIVTRGTQHGNHSNYVWGEALPDGRIAIAYNVGVDGVNGNGLLDAYLGIVGPLGSSLEVVRVNPTAAQNTQVYAIQDLAVRSDGTIELVYNDASTGGDGYNRNDTLIERFGVADAGETAVGGSGAGEVLAGGNLGDTLFGNGGDDVVYGNGGSDVLNGGEGRDWLDGGSGADRMVGGNGDDTYIVENSGDRTIERAGGGRDLVRSAVSYTLGDHVEDLLLTGLASTAGTGNGLDNAITGNAAANALYGLDGNDRLDGGAGADRLSGGDGDDSYYVDDAGDRVIEASATGGLDTVYSAVSFSLAGQHIERLFLTGYGATSATGNSLVNTLVGNGYHNTLDGGGGNDVMNGGAGNDTYYVDSAGDTVIETVGGGSDTVIASFSYTLSDAYEIENITLAGTANINATGNKYSNILTGNSGNNVLNGKLGADRMSGGDGNDTYYVDNVGDVVIETSATGGDDTVNSYVSFSFAGKHLETLNLLGSEAIDGTGNGLANRINGNGAANRLDGGAGADTLSGGAGDDTYVVDNAGDKVIEASASGGNDTVLSSVSFNLAGLYIETLQLTGSGAVSATGNSLANTLIGNGAANTLSGLGGDDDLSGGGGSDTLSGGAGVDSFRFDSALGAGNVDAILDFSVADDTIYLSRAVFAAIGADGTLDPTAFHAGSAAADADDRIVYDAATGNIFYDADGSGGGAQILFATVAAGTALTHADFSAWTPG